VFDFLTLDQAAAELGTSPQGVVLLLEGRGLAIRRLERSGRTLSGLSRVELELLRAGCEAPGQGTDAADLRQRLVAAELALEEARGDRELAREACERLARLTGRAEAAERQADELRAALAAEQAALESALAQAAERDARAAERELVLQAERAAAERALVAERERTEAARAERREAERRLAAEIGRQQELWSELRAARELEAANARFLDQVERKLAAANHTIAHLRRRSA